MIWKCLEFGGARLANAEPSHIRVGITIRLPFRLAFTTLARLKAKTTSDDEICFHNDLMVPENIEHRQLLTLYRANPRLWWTDCAVILRPAVEPSEKVVQQIKDGKALPPQWDMDAFRYASAFTESALNMVNSSVIAYHEATAVMVGGEPLRTIDDYYYIFNRRAQLWLVCPTEYTLSDADILKIILEEIQTEPAREAFRVGEVFPSGDIDTKAIQEIVWHQADNVFYDFAFQANSYAMQGHKSTALLMIVVALEAAHGALLRYTVDKWLGDKKNENLSAMLDNILREEGFYKVLPLTVELCLDDGDVKPTKDEMEWCLKGVTIRNGIMHALANKGGPRVRQLTDEDLTKAKNSVWRVFECFSAALERRGLSKRKSRLRGASTIEAAVNGGE